MGLLVGVVCLCLVATLAVAIPPPIAAPNSVQISPEQMEAGSKETAGEIGAADKKAPPPPPEIQPVVASMEVHPDVAPEVSLGASKDSLPIPKLTDDRKDVVDDYKPIPQQPEQSQFYDMIVVLPTVRRFQKDGSPAPERYLAPLVDKLWFDMSAEQRQHVRFFVLNSDKEPEMHEEANSLATHPGVTLFTKMSKKEEIVSQTVAGHNELEDGRSVSSSWLGWVASENVDASFLFEKAKHQASYILFLEDDVMPTTNALKKLNSFLIDFRKDDWLFLDLYTPNLNWREGMLDVANGQRYAFECCTQSMLFRSDRIDGVIQYLSEHAREPIDDNLRNYMRDYTPGMGVYAVRPNLFEHVGAYSSNKEKSTGVVEHRSLDFVPLLL